MTSRIAWLAACVFGLASPAFSQTDGEPSFAPLGPFVFLSRRPGVAQARRELRLPTHRRRPRLRGANRPGHQDCRQLRPCAGARAPQGETAGVRLLRVRHVSGPVAHVRRSVESRAHALVYAEGHRSTRVDEEPFQGRRGEGPDRVLGGPHRDVADQRDPVWPSLERPERVLVRGTGARRRRVCATTTGGDRTRRRERRERQLFHQLPPDWSRVSAPVSAWRRSGGSFAP